jgi:GNAT superfamily N-acetyltransferase
VEVRIELLVADSPVLETVLGWHWREWSPEAADADLELWRSRLRARTRTDGVPFTFVAFVDEEPVGCISVCHDDLDARYTHRGPWLSGVYVVGAARNLGIGRSMVDAACDRARSFGVSDLWLHTGEASAFYERCRWTLVHGKESLRDDAVFMTTL